MAVHKKELDNQLEKIREICKIRSNREDLIDKMTITEYRKKHRTQGHAYTLEELEKHQAA